MHNTNEHSLKIDEDMNETVALKELDKGLDKGFEQNGEATGYMECLEKCGNCCLKLQCCCATCGCGPLKTINQGEVGLRMKFGKFVSKLEPGLYTFNPCTEKIIIVDLRSQVIDVGLQRLLTKDNVTVFIDAYVNYSVIEPEKAQFKVINYRQLMSYFTQGVMRTIVSEHTLSELLINRKMIEKKLTEIIDVKTHVYGLKVYNIETQKIQLPANMERAMAIVAETEKQSEARIIDAKGDLQSARIFREAADELSKNEISLQLQYFETLKYIAAEKNSTIIVPDSIMGSLKN